MIKDRIIDMVSFRVKLMAESRRGDAGGDADKVEEQPPSRPERLADDILHHFLEYGLRKFRPEKRNSTSSAHLYVLFLVSSFHSIPPYPYPHIMWLIGL